MRALRMRLAESCNDRDRGLERVSANRLAASRRTRPGLGDGGADCGDRDLLRRRSLRGRAVVAGHGADGAAVLPLPAARAGHSDGGRRHHRVPDRRHGRLHDGRQLRLYRRVDGHRQAPRPRHPDRPRGLTRRRCDLRRVRGGRAGGPRASAPPDLRVGDRQRRRPRRGDRPHPGHGWSGRTTQTRFRHGAAALAVLCSSPRRCGPSCSSASSVGGRCRG